MKEKKFYSLYRNRSFALVFFETGVFFPSPFFLSFFFFFFLSLQRTLECNFSPCAPPLRACSAARFFQYLCYNETKIPATRLRCKSTRETFQINQLIVIGAPLFRTTDIIILPRDYYYYYCYYYYYRYYYCTNRVVR